MTDELHPQSYDPVKEQREKELYGLSNEEKERQWQSFINASMESFKKLEDSKLRLHIADKWHTAAYMVCLQKHHAYEEYCDLLVQWRVLTREEIKRIEGNQP